MKTIVIAFLTTVMVTITAFELYRSDTDATQEIGLKVIAALQRNSAHEFSALFPTLPDFHHVMETHAELYGTSIAEAARDFEREFDHVLHPEFKKSFENILREGRGKGIDWRTAQFVSAAVPEKIAGAFAAVPLTIHFTADGKPHRLTVEKALVINGRWRITQHMRVE